MIKEYPEFDEIVSQLKGMFAHESSGHDFWHLQRVYNLSIHIAEKENANPIICGLAAWLHEFDDQKLANITGGITVAVDMMQDSGFKDDTIEKVKEIITTVSFKGAKVDTPMSTIEGNVVRDADRLDAIGAIGIARTFSFGGQKNRLIYHPDIKPVCHTSASEYRNNKAPTINHFYEKLLLLSDRMNTQTAKEIAKSRHMFMEEFLKQFYQEWDFGK